jgi:hypothetical protein
VAKCLNKILKSLKEGGRLKVIQVTKELAITHLLFVYDVFLFGNGSSREEKMIGNTLLQYCIAI